MARIHLKRWFNSKLVVESAVPAEGDEQLFRQVEGLGRLMGPSCMELCPSGVGVKCIGMAADLWSERLCRR